MRLRFFIFMLLASAGICLTEQANLCARDKSPQQQEALKRAHILQSINLLRSMQRLPVLTFAPHAVVPKDARIFASANSGGTIAGRLNGLMEYAIKTAWVVAWTADSSGGRGSAGLGTVDPNGDYKIADLAPGDYYLLAAADGYFPKFYKNVLDFSDATPVKVVEGSVTSGIDFDMEKIQSGTGSISGTVLRQSDAAPIKGAQVSVFSPDNPFLYGWAETSESGEYKIQSLKTGKYHAYVWAEGYLPEYFDDAPFVEQATIIEVVEPNEKSDINFALTSGGIISGIVVNDDGAPIAGAYVQASSAKLDSTGTDPRGLGWGWAITDDTGKYRIGGLATGSYLVLAQVWQQWNSVYEWYDNVSTPEEATPVPVEAEKETANIDFQLALPKANGIIYGTVTDLQSQPIAGAFVQAQSPFQDPSGRIDIWAYAMTDSAGNYRITDLPDGGYLVSASAQSGWHFVQRWWPDAESPDQAQPVIVSGATDPAPADFHLPLAMGNATIAGTVRADDGRALANAFIQISPALSVVDPNGTVQPSGIWAYGYSDSSGHYRVDRLPTGAYFVQTQYWENFSFGQEWYDNANSLETATPVSVVDGEIRDGIDFSLTIRPVYGSVAGTVVNEASGDVISRAYVEVSPVNWDYKNFAPFIRWPYYAITNESGNYRLEWLPEGEYLVSVYAKGAFEYFENAAVPELATRVKVTGGETSAVNFGLTPRNEGSGIISGKVGAEYTDQLLEIAVVVARPLATILIWPQSEMFFNTVINPDGSYEISGLPPGEYYVRCFAPGYIEEYYDNVYDPAQAKSINVDGITPTTGIDFSLTPVLYLRSPDAEAGGRSGGNVFGKVADTNGKALHGATVYLLNNDGKPVSSVRSNVDGTYELQGIPPGSYRAQASELGHESQFNGNAESLDEAPPIDLSNGKVEVNFALAPRAVTGVNDPPASIVPKSIELYGNYPNPFNPETRISFGLPSTMRVKLRVFNVLGEEVAVLHDGVMSAGVHHPNWNGRDRTGREVTSGVYVYHLESATTSLNGKMLLIR